MKSDANGIKNVSGLAKKKDDSFVALNSVGDVFYFTLLL